MAPTYCMVKGCINFLGVHKSSEDATIQMFRYLIYYCDHFQFDNFLLL